MGTQYVSFIILCGYSVEQKTYASGLSFRPQVVEFMISLASINIDVQMEFDSHNESFNKALNKYLSDNS